MLVETAEAQFHLPFVGGFEASAVVHRCRSGYVCAAQLNKSRQDAPTSLIAYVAPNAMDAPPAKQKIGRTAKVLPYKRVAFPLRTARSNCGRAELRASD